MAVSTSASASANGASPKSTHVSDPALRPFLQSSFDPADYLNATLPSLSLSSLSSRPLKQANAASLPDLSSQTQELLSQLNAHTTRLSAILTHLTDDILRSGGRLAYEVEVLRGETIGLTETLTEGLKEDVANFIPQGLPAKSDASAEEEQEDHSGDTKAKGDRPAPVEITPAYISDLAKLHLIRSRLESVKNIFGEATQWTPPPYEDSSFISVQPPTQGATATTEQADGRDFAASLRSEITDLVSNSEDGAAGIAAAAERIQTLRDLAQVWKGTAEYDKRIKLVDELEKLAKEKSNVWNMRQQQQQQKAAGGRSRSASNAKNKSQPPVPVQKTGGFLDNLQRLREGIDGIL